MNTDTIGNWAGLVWQMLSEKGPLTLKEIKNGTKLREKDVYAAIGWLAREGKVVFLTAEGRDTSVALA